MTPSPAERLGREIERLSSGSASDRARAARFEAVLHQHVTYFRRLLEGANRLYRGDRHDAAIGLARFDRNRAEFVACRMITEARLDRSLWAQLLFDYIAAGVDLLLVRLTARDRLSWFDAQRTAAVRIGDSTGEATALGNLGIAWNELGEPRRAVVCYESAFECLAHADGEPPGALHGNLGLAYAMLGDTRQAVDCHRRHLGIARRLGDRIGEGNAQSNLGSAYADLGDLECALDAFERARALSRQTGDARAEQRDRLNLGNVRAAQGDLPEARIDYQVALDLARANGDRYTEGSALGNLGLLCDALEQFDDALELHEQHLAIAREIGDRGAEGDALTNLAGTHRELGQFDVALHCHERHLALSREVSDPRREGVALYGIATIKADLGDVPAARRLLRTARDLVSDASSSEGEMIRQAIDALPMTDR